MSSSEAPALRWHEDREFFEVAVTFTSATTGFSPRLVEKDYFCTVVLGYLSGVEELVFKGGTCLAKVHTAFYRLSEDLDFVIPMPSAATRGQRSGSTRGLKHAMAELPSRLPVLSVVKPLDGSNESRQYLATLGYPSIVTGDDESIKVEVGLREPLLDPPLVAPAATLLRDPVTDSPMVAPIQLPCMSLREAYSEKVRAAVSRREPAIRDFFDLDYAVRTLGTDLLEPELLDMAGAKLRVPGNAPVDVSSARLGALRQQLDTELRPVLRPAEFAAFDLDRVFRIVSDVAAALGKAR